MGRQKSKNNRNRRKKKNPGKDTENIFNKMIRIISLT